MKTYLIMSLLLLSSCATGPETEKKSPLNYLSGEHYKGPQGSIGIPLVVRRKKKSTQVNGECFFKRKNDDFKYPVKFQKISLYKNKTEVAKGTTDGSGKFIISSYLENGTYLLKVESKKYIGSTEIQITKYKHLVALEVDKRN